MLNPYSVSAHLKMYEVIPIALRRFARIGPRDVVWRPLSWKVPRKGAASTLGSSSDAGAAIVEKYYFLPAYRFPYQD